MCRSCWGEIRKNIRINPRVAKKVTLKCTECDELKTINYSQRGKYSEKYYCRTCYLSLLRRGLIKTKPDLKVLVICPDCGKERFYKPSHIKRLSGYCSSCARRGSKNGSWRGGIKDQKYPRTWNEKLRKKIRERDAHTCQECYMCSINPGLDVHHIDYDKENSFPSNLISLCKSCHSKTDIDNEGEGEKFLNKIAQTNMRRAV